MNHKTERQTFMKLYAPRYYKKFRCISHQCRHSCCIGWEIDINETAFRTYVNLTEGYGREIKSTIEVGDPPRFKLTEDERCPHLDERGLCKIILNLGEDYICNICKEHPRFYHNTRQGKEVGLGMACEEACRLILSSDEYAVFEEIGDVEDTVAEETTFDPLPHRDKIYAILSDATLPYAQRLQRISREYRITPCTIADEEWRNILDYLEYLDEEHRTLFSRYTAAPHSPATAEHALERALAYFIYRHCSDVEDEEDFRISLGFALFCERLLASLLAAENIPDEADICEAARIISEEIEYNEENGEAIRLAFLF